jgi:hypothetical protein
MPRIPTILILLLTLAAAASAHPVLERIAADLDTGLITPVEASLHELSYVFDYERLPERYRVEGAPPLMCATPVLIRAERLRPRMTVAQLAVLDELTRPRIASKDSRELISPTGRFRLSYETEGEHRVPLTDIDPPNGVPDFVENCAAYMDSSWASLVVRHGFEEALNLSDRYDVTFENMSGDLAGALGYCQPIPGSPGYTRIAILNSLQQLADSDPMFTGIVHMVCAHEFKHASQAATSLFGEGDWVELDATWSQDVVFDEENDYRRYLSGESVGPSCLSHPHVPLDDRDEVAGLYEEMLWQTWMSETWGVEIIKELWDRRRDHGAEEMLDSYARILESRGVSFEEGFATFTGWNHLSGSRAVSNIGYKDAADYPSVPLAGTVAVFPTSHDDVVNHLASRHFYVAGIPDSGWLVLDFDGVDGAPLALVATVRNDDGTGSLHHVPLDAANDASYVVPVPLDQVSRMGIVVSNPSTYEDGSAFEFTASILTPPPLEIAQASLDLELAVGASGSAPLTLSVPASGPDLVWSAAAVIGDEPAPWLGLDPAGGTVASGGSVDVTVSAAAGGLEPGVHTADVLITFADDDAPAEDARDFRLRVPVELTVTPSGAGVVLTSVGPNPSRGEVTLSWSGAKAGSTAMISVHDLRGRLVRSHAVDVLSVGATSWTWDGRNDDGRPSPSGRYVLRVSTPTGEVTGSVVMVR